MQATATKTDEAARALARLAAGLGTPARVERPIVRVVRAGFDAARTTGENRRHWANADALSPVAAAGSGVRATLRNRARYEVANNSIARGIVLTLANDLVGAGPRLQLATDSDRLNRKIERAFGQWARAIRLPAKLRTMRAARAQDGEAFGVTFTNAALPSPVKLDVELDEADRVTTPNYGLAVQDEDKAVDGIVYDEYGNPREYHVLRSHPGARKASAKDLTAYDRVPAASVLHWYRQDRPGQRRGLPDLLPALPLFALLRRWTLATLTAAETAADLAVIMKTAAPVSGAPKSWRPLSWPTARFG